jgi:putative membrane protein
MQPDPSLSTSIDKAKKHYSSLFSLPKYQTSLFAITAICAIGVTLTAWVFLPIEYSLTLGIIALASTIIADLTICKVLLKDDPIFNVRRTSVVSLTGWLFWILFLALGAALGYFLDGMMWVKFALIGFGAVLTLRFLVMSTVATGAKWRQITAALIQPLLVIAVFLFIWFASYVDLVPILPFIVLAPIISYTAVYLFLQAINRLGKSGYHLPALPLFRAFLTNWVTDANEPLEAYLEKMGQDADIDVSLLKFDAAKPKAAIVMPLVHPGPFKNIGSSLLPSLLKHGYEKEYGCSACTPLGILGHELDLASQAQNQKIVSEVLTKAKFEAQLDVASPFVKATDGAATAICQIFGDTVLLAFTLAPQTTEDLPQELGRMVTDEARRYGFKHTIIVNAHNCLGEVDDTAEHVDELKRAAFKCLLKATSETKKPFRVGSATVFPADFTQKQGMGTGGITAITVEVAGQKTAYIVIDGNNMVPHLREKILSALSGLGFDESEVFTTDTHAVSALSTGRRGYHPLGEAIDHDALIRYIKQAAQNAAANLETARAGCVKFTVPHVRVIGEERLKSISVLVDEAIEKAKHIVVPVFGIEGLLMVLLLFLF